MIRRPCARLWGPLPYLFGPLGAARNGDPWPAPGFPVKSQVLWAHDLWELLRAGFRHSVGLHSRVIHGGATCRPGGGVGLEMCVMYWVFSLCSRIDKWRRGSAHEGNRVREQPRMRHATYQMTRLFSDTKMTCNFWAMRSNCSVRVVMKLCCTNVFCEWVFCPEKFTKTEHPTRVGTKKFCAEHREKIQGETDEPDSWKHQQEEDEMEAKRDSWWISWSVITFKRDHSYACLKKLQFLSYSSYIIVVRRTHTTLDMLQGCQIDNYCNVGGDWQLSESRTSFTLFTLFNTLPSHRNTWSGGRRTMIKTTSKSEKIWPQNWWKIFFLKKSKKKTAWSRGNRCSENPRTLSKLMISMWKTWNSNKPLRMCEIIWRL